MAKAAMFGARQLMDAPLDPKYNADGMYSSHTQGSARPAARTDQVRALGRPAGQGLDSLAGYRSTTRMMKTYFETRAWIAKGDTFKADEEPRDARRAGQGDR